MWVAVLRRAIWDFAMYREASRDSKKFELAADAAGWIWFDGEELGTFLAICGHLDLDPVSLRRQILKLYRKDVEKINKRIETE